MILSINNVGASSIAFIYIVTTYGPEVRTLAEALYFFQVAHASAKFFIIRVVVLFFCNMCVYYRAYSKGKC